MTPRLRTLPYLLLLLPFDLVVALCLCASVPLCSKTRRRRDTETQRAQAPATIIIVNWDGRQLLAECLPSVVEAVQHDGGKHEILVVDNGSTDGSVDFVREHFPCVHVLALDRNYGFAEGNNRAIAQARTDIVVLLNNDMVVNREFLRPLLDGFSDPIRFRRDFANFFPRLESPREKKPGKHAGVLNEASSIFGMTTSGPTIIAARTFRSSGLEVDPAQSIARSTWR